jgi:hypothetical protein
LANNSAAEVDVYAGTWGYSANYVNNFMVEDGYLNSTLAAGETTTETVYFALDNLKLSGINKISEIGLGLSVKDADNKQIYEGTANIKTSTYETANYDQYGLQTAFSNSGITSQFNIEVKSISEDTMFDAGNIKILGNTYAKNKSDEYLLILNVANEGTTGAGVRIKNIMSGDSVIYDGNWTGNYICAGKQALVDINLNDIIEYGDLSDEEQAEIDPAELTSLTFEIDAYDENYNTLLTPTTVTVNF